MPAAYPLLLEALERDPDLRAKFFKNMRGLGYGGALLPQESFDRLQSVATGQLSERLPFTCGWGMTETTSTGLMVYWNVDRAGLLGLPQPGMLAKLVPAGDRYELRVKGPNIMPGYWRNPEATAEAFDEEGFFKTGDAARWVDESRPEAGIAFAGRLSEEFKLASGTWVRATTLRTQLIDALQPYVRDLVIAAPDRPWLGALVWLDEGCRSRGRPGGRRSNACCTPSTSAPADRACASSACCRSPSRRTPAPARSPTSARSTRGGCWSGARPRWRGSMPSRRTPPSSADCFLLTVFRRGQLIPAR